MLGKANSLSKIVKLCVFCLFVKLRLSPGRVEGPYKDIPGYRSSGKIRVVSRGCTKVPITPPGGGENTNSRFLRFFVRSVPFFRSLMLTPMKAFADRPIHQTIIAASPSHARADGCHDGPPSAAFDR